MSARFGPFELDSDRRQLLKSGSDVHLTPKAFDLLALLTAEAPRVVKKGELHERLWPGTFVSTRRSSGLQRRLFWYRLAASYRFLSFAFPAHAKENK